VGFLICCAQLVINRRLKEIDDMTVNAAAPLSGTMDVDEFMAFMETRPKEEHWDLIDGVAVMMSPATDVHQRVAYNFCRLLDDAITARRLKLIACLELGVRNPGVLNFQPRPDVVVIPGPARVNLYSTGFQLAAEVLSPSNTRREIDLKLRRYCEAPANLHAVVIDPLAFMVEIYAKSRKWDRTVLKRPDDVIEMPEFGLRCHVADLYRGTELDPEWANM
jgi:Uma2 family endonuclease